MNPHFGQVVAESNLRHLYTTLFQEEFIYHHIIYQSLFPYQNKHQNQKVTINHMYNKKTKW